MRLHPFFLLLLHLFPMLTLVACVHPDTPSYPPAPPAQLLDMLLADYRKLGLPLPPPDALLVRWETPAKIRGADGKTQNQCHLAFALPTVAGDPYPRLLIGTEYHQPSAGATVRVEPTAEAAEGIQGRFQYPSADHLYPINAALGTAIQAKARGWDALAERLFDMASKIGVGEPGCYQDPGTPPRKALAVLARSHYANELLQPGADSAAVARRFEASLIFGGPIPCSSCWRDGHMNCTFDPLHRRTLQMTVEHP